jgi:type II secretory pathway component GspD/PulD (secretin)
MSKSLLLVLVALVGCRSKPDVAPQTAANARATAGLVEVVPLKYAAAPELAQTLNGLVGAESTSMSIVADARTNSLVVESADTAELQRLLDLIARLDVDATKPVSPTDDGSVRIIPLRYATAAELADTLNDLADASRRSAASRGTVGLNGVAHDPRMDAVAQARIVADPRTNSLVVRSDADRPEAMKQIVDLIARLDVEAK